VLVQARHKIRGNVNKYLRSLDIVPKQWKELKLKDVFDIKLSGVDKKSYHGQREVLLCNYTDVYNNDYITSDMSFSKATATPAQINNYSLQLGDVIITKDSETPYDIGVPSVVIDNLQNVLCGYHLALLRPDKRLIDPIYMANAISHTSVRKQFFRSANGITRFGLTKTAIQNINILIPPLPEQSKIGIILDLWKKNVNLLNKLLKEKRLMKQALMQRLVTGKLRFKDFKNSVFHKTEIGKFLIPTSRPTARPIDSYTALGIRSHGKGTFLRNIDDPETVMMDTLYEVKENDLIVNITFAWEGAIAIVKKSDEGALVSHRFPTYTFNRDKVIPEYFKHIIQTKRFVHELGLVSPGGAGRNRVLSKKDFLNIVIAIPSVDEQKKIAALLNGIDREIELLKKKLECLITQKKGLMQKLLTGRIRVKV
jgi:type I restriction enzyme S subunit